jgi:hypothetical protein
MQHQSTTAGARLLTLALITGVLLGLPVPFIAHAQQADNLLANPGFEPFVTPEGQYDYPLFRTDEGGGHIAEGWSPWWYNDEGAAYAAPEYDIAPISRDPFRVHSGNAAQQIFRPSVLWAAGVYQRVRVPANASLRFTIYGHAWATFCQPLRDGGSDCGDSHDSYYGLGVNPPTMKIGIDPTGGTHWASPTIMWSQDYRIYDHYEQLVVDAQAQGEYVTVFTYTTFMWPAAVNNVYWDDAALTVNNGGDSATPSGLALEANTTVNVRTGPGLTHAVIGQIRPGAFYAVLGQSGDWYRIDFDGRVGYVYGPLTAVSTVGGA